MSTNASPAVEPFRKHRRQQQAASRVAPPPPPSPPPSPQPRPSASSSSSASSSASSLATLTTLPSVLTTLLDAFLGVHARRPLAHTVSRALRETENKKCTEQACLASPVPRLCVDGCVLRGERLVAQAYAIDAGVTDSFVFRRLDADGARLTMRFHFVDDTFLGADDAGDSKVEAKAPAQDERRAPTNDGDGTMRITFSLQRLPQNPTNDARLTADALEWDELYAPETEPNAVAREIEAEIAREERRQIADAAARDRARREGKSAPPRRHLIDVAAGLRRLRSLYRPPSELGRLMTELARRRTHWSETKLAVDAAHEKKRLLSTWRAATDRPFRHEFPDSTQWLRVYPVPWVAHVLRVAFRGRDDARSWRSEFAHDRGLVLSGRVPVTQVGVLMRRMLSEPTDVFNELALDQPRETRVSLQDPAATTRAALLVLRGIRVWRGSDIVASRFRVVDQTVVDRDYPRNRPRLTTVSAEFARLFPAQPAPFVSYGAPGPDDEKKRAAAATAPGNEGEEE